MSNKPLPGNDDEEFFFGGHTGTDSEKEDFLFKSKKRKEHLYTEENVTEKENLYHRARRLCFDKKQKEEEKECWKTLIVDDDPDVHDVTRHVMQHFSFDSKPLKFISAYSGKEAKSLMEEHPDIVLILLDVVMEDSQAGLKVVEYIRTALHNKLVRIVLFTGQPGEVPEESIIVEYDINDYALKTELTHKRLFTSIVSALRSYRDMWRISKEFHTLLNAISDPLILLSPGMRAVWTNKQAMSLLHSSNTNMTEQCCKDIFKNPNFSCDSCPVKKTFRTGKEEALELSTDDGRFWDIKTFPIKDEQGKVINVIEWASDITEKKVLEAENIRTKQLASLGEIAAGVAHEINNPINSIINCAQILINKSSEENKTDDIAPLIIKEGKRIAAIVRCLLSFARPGNRQMNPASIDMILSDTLTLIGEQIKKDGITIKKNIPHDLPFIKVNYQEIEQVFLNIISNARYALNQKFPDTDKNKYLEIKAEKKQKSCSSFVRISFYDRGTGIPSHIKDKVIKPFFSTKILGIGTGLGLSISHNIINDHGGKIMLDSVEGEFTKIIIDLPMYNKNER